MWVYEEDVAIPASSKHFKGDDTPQKLTSIINSCHENVKYFLRPFLLSYFFAPAMFSVHIPVLLVATSLFLKGSFAQTISGPFECTDAGEYTLCQNLWGKGEA